MLRVTKKTIRMSVLVLLVVSVFLLFSSKTEPTVDRQVKGVSAEVVTVFAKAGYRPNKVIAPAGKDVILRIETRNTYDCSASFLFPDLHIDTLLPPTGFTDFQIPPQKSGTVISGGCSMGMYGLDIQFQ